MATQYDVRAVPLYTKEHTWVRDLGDGTVRIGITDYAQDQLGEILFVDLPKPGAAMQQMEPFGTIESAKAVSDLYAPVGGTVKAVNTKLAEDPRIVNKDPYDAGWLVVLEAPQLDSERKNLLSADAYRGLIKEVDE